MATKLHTLLNIGGPILVIGGLIGLGLRHRYNKNKLNMVGSFHYQQAMLIRRMEEYSMTCHCVCKSQPIDNQNNHSVQ